jgi:hypothetical protein
MEAREIRLMVVGDLGRCSLALIPRPRAGSGGVGGTRWACQSAMRLARWKILVPGSKCANSKENCDTYRLG